MKPAGAGQRFTDTNVNGTLKFEKLSQNIRGHTDIFLQCSNPRLPQKAPIRDAQRHAHRVVYKAESLRLKQATVVGRLDCSQHLRR